MSVLQLIQCMDMEDRIRDFLFFKSNIGMWNYINDKTIAYYINSKQNSI